MRDTDRYLTQADEVTRQADKAQSPAEKDVYLSIAEGWRKLANEAERTDRPRAASESRSFQSDDR